MAGEQLAKYARSHGVQMGDALIEFMREPGKMVFLAVVACHAILAAADGYADMSHDQVSLRRTHTDTGLSAPAAISAGWPR